MPLKKEKLPLLTKDAHENFFKLTERMDLESSLLLFNFYVSKLLCFNRVQIEVPGDYSLTFPNLYCLSFGESGTGKDRSRKRMDDMTSFLFDEKERMEGDYKKDKLAQLEKEADKEKLSKMQKRTFIKEGTPRSLFSRVKSTSTPEGVAAVHEALNDAGFGEITWIDGEISETMARYRAATPLDDLIVTIKEAYDLGSFESKLIKSNLTLKVQGNVPYIAWLHGAMDEQEGAKLFNKFLSLGYSRRTIINLNNTPTKDTRTIEEIEQEMTIANEQKKFIKMALEDIYKRVKVNLTFKYGNNKIFKLDKDAAYLYLQYKQKCENDSIDLIDTENSIIRREVGGRFWKALKLSCCFAVQNHSKLVITKEDLEQAIHVIDFFGSKLSTFLNVRVTSDFTLAENMIASLRKNIEMKRTDFYTQDYFPKRKSNQVSIFNENIKIASEILESTNEFIHEQEVNKRQTNYRILKTPEHALCSIENRENDLKIRLSEGKSDRLTETEFEAIDINFQELHTITGASNRYSPSVFNQNKRSVKNWTGQNDLLILDIDNDKKTSDDVYFTVEDAMARFSGFVHLITTTKSHQKEKKGIVADRFRIILPIQIKTLSNSEYKKIVKQIIQFFSIDQFCDYQASSDPSRMYGANAEQKHFYNLDGYLMDPTAYLYDSNSKGGVKRPISPTQIFTVRGNPLSLNMAIEKAKESYGRTIPCRAFCHDDKVDSAFFVINDHGNLQYTCSACGISQFFKLK